MFLASPLIAALDVVSLTMTVVNVGSADRDELADQLEDVLRAFPYLHVERYDSTVVARTDLGHPERVVLVGRIDLDASDPESDPESESGEESGELLARVEMGKLYGPGACDALGGVAIMLKMAVLGSYTRDLTLVFAGSPEAPEIADATVTVRMRPTDSRLERGGSAGSDGAVEAGQEPGWADLTRLAAGGASELSYGPGDPATARTPDEFVPTAQLTECEHAVKGWLRA